MCIRDSGNDEDAHTMSLPTISASEAKKLLDDGAILVDVRAVSYTHLRAHETVLDLVCRLLLEKKKYNRTKHTSHTIGVEHNRTVRLQDHYQLHEC
mgnify:CR=1 FL=1